MEQSASIEEQNPLTHQQQQDVIPVASLANYGPSSSPPPLPPPPPPPPPLPRSRARPSPNLPSMDLINGSREDYFNICVPLHEASMKGDWKAAKAILDLRPALVRCSITENGETALHIVASSGRRGKQVESFVQNLVNLMTKKDLALQNKDYNTAFHLAVVGGHMPLLKIMVQKNEELLKTRGGKIYMMPLYLAALFRKHEVVKHLYKCSSQDLSVDANWTLETISWLVETCMEGDMFDVAQQIMKNYPNLSSGRLLIVLARKPHAFTDTKSNVFGRTMSSVFSFIGSKVGAPEKESKALQLLRIIWDDIVKKSKREINDLLRGPPDSIKQGLSSSETPQHATYSSRTLFIAAEMGNTKFVVELIRRYPELLRKVNDDNQTIFHIAVKHRHQDIYNLLYELGTLKDFITPLRDKNDNNLLHLAAIRAAQLEDVSGVLLQMQQELIWFKEVESIMLPTYAKRKNKDGLTARELFTKEHKDLTTQGEKWTKETASLCMIVATLIATIVFASAFMVPGGYNQTTGIPLLYSTTAFKFFVVADVISLFSSSASILIFLSILTSRYAQRDFMESLPRKLIFGLSTLFLSITTMMIAFSVSFFVLYDKDLKWMPILISMLAAIPVLLYVESHYKLFTDVIRSASLFKLRKNVLYT